ncbi:histidine phosphatase family protein [Alkalibacterium sp. s-m-22]
MEGSKNMKNIITIQHTQAVHHTTDMVGSWTDWELTDLGKAHAENIGRRLSAEFGDKPCKIYCSDLTRTKQTAEPIARYLGLSVEYRKELREHNIGADAIGKPRKWQSKNQSPIRTIDDKPFPDAESGRDVWNRMSAFCKEIVQSDDENIIIVSHGFCLPMFFSVWLGWDIEMLSKCEFGGRAGGVSRMSENADGIRIIQYLNDMSYAMEDAR